MMTRAVRRHPPFALAVGLLTVILAGCGSAAPTSATAPPGSAAPAALSVLPAVDGFAYGPAGNAVSVFVDSATATLGGEGQFQVLDAAVATRDEDQVLVIAFSFPGASDTQAVDFFARIVDGLEDGVQAGSQRGLGGAAYVIETEDRSLILGPWGRIGEDLVFLFTHGPTEATTDLATAILNPAE